MGGRERGKEVRRERGGEGGREGERRNKWENDKAQEVREKGERK